MSTTHAAIATPPPTARSAVANGSRLFLESVDGRSAEARRFRDLLADLVQHLGGEDAITEPQRHLARRAAALAVWCESQEVALAKGEDMDVAQYVTASNSLRRLLGDLGLQRAPRDITTIDNFLTRHAVKPEREAESPPPCGPLARGGVIMSAVAASEPDASEPLEESHSDEPVSGVADTAEWLSAYPAPPQAEETTEEPEAEPEPQPGDSFTIAENGATVAYVETEDGDRPWAVIDAAGILCGRRQTRAEAERFARRDVKAPPWWKKDTSTEQQEN